MVRVLRDSGASKSTKEEAAAALGNLAANADNQVAIAKAGGIGPLVGLLTSPSAGAQERARDALKRLAKNSELKAAIEKAGGPKFGGWFWI